MSLTSSAGNDKSLTPPLPETKPYDSPHRPLILKGVDNDAVKEAIRQEEEIISYMYKDTAEGGGKVKVGDGLMLPNVEAAKKLPFEIDDGKGSKRRATDKEIESAFKKVDAIKNDNSTAETFKPGKGDKAKDYNLDNLTLPDDVSERLLDEHLRASADELRKKIPNFDELPSGAQQALLDMQYNLGSNKFSREKWPKLFDAVDKGDMARAAQESNRTGIGQGRNNRTKDKFLDEVRSFKKR